MARDKKPAPIIERTRHGLMPIDAETSEQVLSDPLGTQYDLIKRGSRSNKQLRTYWRALGIVVKSTGKWATPEHLHDELKLACGYHKKIVNWNTGEIILQADSIALENMKPDVFNEYMTVTMAKLAERVGFDPLAFLKEAA
ncbi:MAG: hypothetical protein GY943_30410 [Chloroflexi bacterium]|nr:hypothetical protein [Chloroflexota bacterium]